MRVGLFDAFVNAGNKGHELGAGYLLIKEARGVISDFRGTPLDDGLYEPHKKYDVVAAGNEKLRRELIRLL